MVMQKILSKCDVVIVGNHTYKTAKEPLSKRNCIVLTRKVRKPKRAAPNLLFINPGYTNLKRMITALKYKRAAILGGAQVYTYCLEHDMMDELYLTVEPVIFGGGIPLFDGKFDLRQTEVRLLRKLNSAGAVLIHAHLPK